MKKKIIILIVSIFLIVLAAVLMLKKNNSTRPLLSYLPTTTCQNEPNKNEQVDLGIEFIGPRENVPESAPKEKGFWSFAFPVPGILSRSGQPTIQEFQWLKQNGWQSVIDLRVNGERDEITLDKNIPGFNELSFNYLEIPIPDGSAPTDQQAEQFLKFVTKKENQPIHVHCHAGIGRTGTMLALYRYSVQGWPIEDAIKESRAFNKGINDKQKAWLIEWAQKHEPGSYSAN